MNESMPVAPALVAAILSMLAAQAIKPFWVMISERRLDWRRAFDTGGMPSSHTSLVTTLTIAIGVQEGVQSSMFAVALVFSGYFVFEATGLRQEVGHQARVLNEMIEEFVSDHAMHVDAQRLRELVGHTWSEVLGGVVVGILVFLACRPWWS
jgi:hypothetical protein